MGHQLMTMGLLSTMKPFLKKFLSQFLFELRGPRSVDSIVKPVTRAVDSLKQSANQHRQVAAAHCKTAEELIALARTAQTEASRADRTAEKLGNLLA